MKEAILAKKKIIAIIIISLMLYVRCNVGVITNVAVILDSICDGLALIFCVILFNSDKENARKTIISIPVLWAGLFFGLMVISAKIGTRGMYFSTRFALLTIGAAVLIYFILSYMQQDLMQVILLVSILLLSSTIITAIIYDHGTIGWYMGGCFARFGTTMAGKVLDTANLLSLTLIPIWYQLLVKRNIKGYLPIIFVSCIVLLTTGSKTALASTIVVVVMFFYVGCKSKKEILITTIILVILAIIGLILIMRVKFLYDLMGERIVELFTVMRSKEYDPTQSTGQRMLALKAALEHWSEKPIFGHGMYDFRNHEYSAIQPHIEYGEVLYIENMNIHCTFVELLFSLGIVGVIAYFWFPVCLVIKVLKAKKNYINYLVIAYIITMLFIDMSLDMYYKYIIQYFVYFVIYCLLKENNEEQRHS